MLLLVLSKFMNALLGNLLEIFWALIFFIKFLRKNLHLLKIGFSFLWFSVFVILSVLVTMICRDDDYFTEINVTYVGIFSLEIATNSQCRIMLLFLGCAKFDYFLSKNIVNIFVQCKYKLIVNEWILKYCRFNKMLNGQAIFLAHCL